MAIALRGRPWWRGLRCENQHYLIAFEQQKGTATLEIVDLRWGYQFSWQIKERCNRWKTINTGGLRKDQWIPK